jgi:hypothetical protein
MTLRRLRFGLQAMQADSAREWRQLTGISNITVPHAQMVAFASVVARLQGT